MELKFKISTFIGALVFAGSALAFSDKPEACPSISSLQSEGFNFVFEVNTGIYYAFNDSVYDTPSKWDFSMGPLLVDSAIEALEMSNEILATTTGSPTPGWNEQYRKWVCVYDANDDDISVFAEQLSSTKLSSLKIRSTPFF